MKYSEKLKDPRWQRKRLEIFERDNFSCVCCDDSRETLNVHHLYYEKGKDPWDYNNSNLVTLCETCHQGEFDYRRESENTLIKTLKMKKFFIYDIDLLEIAFNNIKCDDDIKSRDLALMIVWVLTDKKAFEDLKNNYKVSDLVL